MLRDNRERAKQAKIWMYIAIGTLALNIIVEFVQLKLISIQRGVFTADYYEVMQNIQTYAILLILIGVVILGINITTWVMFIRWFRRAYYNLHILRPNGLAYGEGMAAGAWFIPIFNWFGPYKIAKELNDYSEGALLEAGHIQANKARKSDLILWWTLWITASILSAISNQGDKIEDLDVQTGFVYMGIFAIIIYAVSGYFCIRFIKNYSEMEVHLHKLLSDEQKTYTVDNGDLLDSGM